MYAVALSRGALVMMAYCKPPVNVSRGTAAVLTLELFRVLAVGSSRVDGSDLQPAEIYTPLSGLLDNVPFC